MEELARPMSVAKILQKQVCGYNRALMLQRPFLPLPSVKVPFFFSLVLLGVRGSPFLHVPDSNHFFFWKINVFGERILSQLLFMVDVH